MKSKLRPTMREVASAANVSVKSVSRVLNGEAPVSSHLRDRVQRAVDRLHYHYNIHAGNLRRANGRSETVGVLLDGTSSLFGSALLRAIQNEALDRGVLVFAGITDRDVDEERALISAFTAHRVDGLIVAANIQDSGLLISEISAGTAMVLVEQIVPNLRSDQVCTDGAGGVRMGMRHLINEGHKRIAYICGPEACVCSDRRHCEHANRLQTTTLVAHEHFVRLNVGGIAAAESATLELLLGVNRPTAVLTVGTNTTIGAARAIRGLGSGDRVAHIGIEDAYSAELEAFGVSIVARNPLASGRVAARLLFRRIDGEDTPPVRRLVQASLVVRGSGEIALAYANQSSC